MQMQLAAAKEAGQKQALQPQQQPPQSPVKLLRHSWAGQEEGGGGGWPADAQRRAETETSRRRVEQQARRREVKAQARREAREAVGRGSLDGQRAGQLRRERQV
jgi:hypothetical protein